VTPAPTALLAGGSLVAGFAVADLTGLRALGGVVLLVAAAVCALQWRRLAGLPAAAALVLVYAAAFAGAHPLARLVGAWPSVVLVAAGTAIVAYLATRGRRAAPVA